MTMANPPAGNKGHGHCHGPATKRHEGALPRGNDLVGLSKLQAKKIFLGPGWETDIVESIRCPVNIHPTFSGLLSKDINFRNGAAVSYLKHWVFVAQVCIKMAQIVAQICNHVNGLPGSRTSEAAGSWAAY